MSTAPPPPPPPSRTLPQFVVRFPEGMRDEIAAAAKAGDRSMNAEIVTRLREVHQLRNDVHRYRNLAHDLGEKLDASQFEEQILKKELQELQEQGNLALPDPLLIQLNEAAKASNRALLGEIVERLERSFEIDARQQEDATRLLELGELRGTVDGLRLALEAAQNEAASLRTSIEARDRMVATLGIIINVIGERPPGDPQGEGAVWFKKLAAMGRAFAALDLPVARQLHDDLLSYGIGLHNDAVARKDPGYEGRSPIPMDQLPRLNRLQSPKTPVENHPNRPEPLQEASTGSIEMHDVDVVNLRYGEEGSGAKDELDVPLKHRK